MSIERHRTTEDRRNLPAKPRGARFALLGIADEKHSRPGCRAPKAQASRRGEIYGFVKACYIGHHRGHGPAGYGLFHGPEQLDDGLRPRQDQHFGVDAEMGQPRPVGQTELLRLVGELQHDESRPIRLYQSKRQPQCKPQGSRAVLVMRCEHFAEGARRQGQKLRGQGTLLTLPEHRRCFQRCDAVAQVFELFLTRAQHGEGSLRPLDPFENK